MTELKKKVNKYRAIAVSLLFLVLVFLFVSLHFFNGSAWFAIPIFISYISGVHYSQKSRKIERQIILSKGSNAEEYY